MIGAIDAPLNGATKLEFENWIKLATDNKINASNSWDVALIDYFHDLSVLREGDGINFQKASATLDGCVKIYTSRIDSAATETGRLLSGLASKNDYLDIDDEEEVDGSDDEEDNNTIAQSVAKKSTHRSGTLAKSFKLIRSKSNGTEIFLDPLFKKTLTEFDEGGARSLLMNMLHIDRNGRVLFDATGLTDFSVAKTDASDTTKGEHAQNRKNIDLSPLLRSMKNDLNFENLTVCPSMDSLRRIATDQGKPEAILEKLQRNDINNIQEDNFDDAFDFNDDGPDAIYEGDYSNQITKSFNFSRLYEEDNNKSHGPNITMLRLFNENFEESVEASYLNALDLNVLDYFDDLSKKSWAGPEHWKISNVRQEIKKAENVGERLRNSSSEEENLKGSETRKSKDYLKIDFFSLEAIEDDVIFSGGKNINQPRSQWSSETYHLLPEDQLFTTKNFIYLSLKPTKLINTIFFGNKKNSIRQKAYDGGSFSIVDDNYHANQGEFSNQFQTEETYYKNKRLQNLYEGDLQEIHESFGDNHFEGGPDNGFDGGDRSEQQVGSGISLEVNQGFGSQLVPSLSKFKPSNINFARVAKRVDVRLLKDNLWESFKMVENKTTGLEDSNHPGTSEASFKFTDVVKDMSTKYSEEQRSDLSTSLSFICLLHLANENGFSMESSNNFTDLNITVHDRVKEV